MRASKSVPKNIDEYIAGFPDDVQQTLEKIRRTIRKAAPGVEETISYLLLIWLTQQATTCCG
jgi:uncharacterized protein YdhG (YjbR/CyaY superfamily)